MTFGPLGTRGASHEQTATTCPPIDVPSEISAPNDSFPAAAGYFLFKASDLSLGGVVLDAAVRGDRY